MLPVLSWWPTVTVRQRTVLRVVFVLALVGVGFIVLQYPFRLVEVWLSGGLLVHFHAMGVESTDGTGIFVRHLGTYQVIDLVVAPQCSSLPAVLGIYALASTMVPTTGSRIYRGATVAAAVALFGNIVRIDAVLGVGALFGFIALVFFHTWIAAMFDFAAVLVGWVIMIRMELGRGPRRRLLTAAATSGDAGRPSGSTPLADVGAPGPAGTDDAH